MVILSLLNRCTIILCISYLQTRMEFFPCSFENILSLSPSFYSLRYLLKFLIFYVCITDSFSKLFFYLSLLLGFEFMDLNDVIVFSRTRVETPGLEPRKKLIKLVAVLFISSYKLEFDFISYFSYLSIPKGSCRLLEFIFYSRLLLYRFRMLFYLTVRILMCSLMADTFLFFIYLIRSMNMLLNLSYDSMFLADLWYIGNIDSISQLVLNLFIHFLSIFYYL